MAVDPCVCVFCSATFFLLDMRQIVNICVDVLTEEVEDGGKKLKDSLYQIPQSGTLLGAY